MYSSFVKKVIARDGEREIVDSSPEEMLAFIVNRLRPDFSDHNILCVKFLMGFTDNVSEAEETSWFINPLYLDDENYHTYERNQSGKLISFIPYYDSYAPKMASEFIPEILLMHIDDKVHSIFDYYEKFHISLMQERATHISDEEKYELFVKFLEENKNGVPIFPKEYE